MRKTMMTVLSACAAAVVQAAGPIDTVEMTTGTADGKSETRTVKLTAQPDGAWRFRLRTIDMRPEWKTVKVVNLAGKSRTGDPGWWLTNDERWGAFTRTDGKKVQSPMRIVLFGGKTAEDEAWCGIVKGMRYECTETVEAKGGAYEHAVTLRLSAVGFNPYEDFVIDYYPLKGADANYSAMGRLYRNWQLGRGEVKPLRERVKGNPNLAYAADSIFVRCKFGRCDRTKTTREDWLKAMPPVLVEYTFDDFKDVMRRAKEIGIGKAEMCLVGFQYGGHDGPFPDLFPADDRFGGQAKMLEAIAYGRSLGYHMDMHINQNNFYLNAKRWNLADVAKDATGEPLKYTVYPGGQVYRSCFEVCCNKYCDKDMDDMESFGINGLFHVDVTSATQPCVCHDPKHPNNRKQMAEWQRRVGEKARARFGGFSSECGLDHVASVLDNALYTSCYPGWHSPKSDLVDGVFPVWHVAYSGIIMSNPFYATIDASYPRDAGSGRTDAVRANLAVTTYLDTPERRTLKVFELNGRPMFYYADYKDLRPMKAMYDAWQPLKHLQFEFIREHVELAPEVFATRYENGEELVTNYTDKPYAYRGREVKPLGNELFAK